MKKSGIITSTVGCALLLTGIVLTARAPIGANLDVGEVTQRLDYAPGSPDLYVRHRINFYEAQLTKRFLIAGLIGISGCGLLIVGVVRLTDE
jgi:hypothetical protein